MPTHCPITFPRLSEDDMRAIDYAVMGHAFATHSQLGRLCDESVYQCELLRRLEMAGVEAGIEIPVSLSHRQFSTQLALDFVVERKVIYELKTVSALTSAHEGQLLGYLFLINATALGVTTFTRPSAENAHDLQKLIAASPVGQLHWVNITHHQVRLFTIRNDRKI